MFPLQGQMATLLAGPSYFTIDKFSRIEVVSRSFESVLSCPWDSFLRKNVLF